MLEFAKALQDDEQYKKAIPVYKQAIKKTEGILEEEDQKYQYEHYDIEDLPEDYDPDDKYDYGYVRMN